MTRFAVFFFTVICAAIAIRADDALVDVPDLFIGTELGGNTSPAAQLPFGFASPGPASSSGGTSGYRASKPTLGFAFTRVSGTGGPSKYNNFLVTPTIGNNRPDNLKLNKVSESASPGLYVGQYTDPEIKVELTATRMVGLSRFTFPSTSQAHLLFNLAHCSGNQKPIESEVRLVAPDRIEGWAHFKGGWNPSPYTLYFAAQTNRKWTSGKVLVDGKSEKGTHAHGTKTSADVVFDLSQERQLQMKLAVSFASIEKARSYLDQQSPGWDFDSVAANARKAWADVLSRINIEGGSAVQRRIFYTALYHSHTLPHELSGDMPDFGNRPHYEDYYCLWDTFRCLHPLLTVLQPKRQSEMVQSMIDVFDQTGWMPDARIAGANGLMQVGTNGDVLVADAMVKGLKGVDYEKAYRALVKNSTVESPRWEYEGRHADVWNKLGYVPLEAGPYSASCTMEYAYDDFCIATVAKRLGKEADYQKFLKRSNNWTNIFDPKTGFVRPKSSNGSWYPDPSPTVRYPNKQVPDEKSPFYESNGWQYTTYVPHDVQGLIDRIGGDEAFVKWLDEFFNKGIYTQANEPDLLAAFLYIHAGRSDRTALRTRKILASEYNDTRTGLPGDDDAGAMSSWYVWNAIGLYPHAGEAYYYVTAPIFKRATIHLEDGKMFIVESPEASDANCYIQSATLNGKPLERAWITHEELISGGELKLQMGSEPSQWAREPRPPSVIPR